MTAVGLLRALAARNAADGRCPPAALIGDWCGVDAVIAPSLEVVAGLAPPDRPDQFWLGYLGFPVRADESALPETAGGLTDGVLMLTGGEWSWLSATGAPCPAWVREVASSMVEPPPSMVEPPSNEVRRRVETTPWTARWTPPARGPHLSAVAHCRAAIAAGEVYQACVCTRFTGTLHGDPHSYFADLAAATTPAKAAFLQGEWGAVMSLSPESFLYRRGGTVTSSPIKGTVARDVDPLILAESAKDVAENVMIVDLVRNDLGRVARVGTVRVPELLTIVGAPGVWHLVSTVSAELDDAVGNDDLLAATFPPASVTGTPKIRAAELISEWEDQPRGVYCGAVGIAGPDGLLDLNVAIRTVTATPGDTPGRHSLTLGVGGGITYDSDPAAEFQECLDKAAAIVGVTRGERPAPPDIPRGD